MGVLGEVEGVVGAAERALEVAQVRVDRLELRQRRAGKLAEKYGLPRIVSIAVLGFALSMIVLAAFNFAGVRADLNLTHPADLNLTRGWVPAS